MQKPTVELLAFHMSIANMRVIQELRELDIISDDVDINIQVGTIIADAYTDAILHCIDECKKRNLI